VCTVDASAAAASADDAADVDGVAAFRFAAKTPDKHGSLGGSDPAVRRR
jgi:hypothetical protein